MLQLQRLTMDSSWHIRWDDTALILDPWLLGSEIDGFRWLNEQWHTSPPLRLADIAPYEGIVLSQSYSDHCHLPTLQKLDATRPILATHKAFHKVQKAFPERALKRIPFLQEGPPLEFGNLQFWSIPPLNTRDPVYYALLVINQANQAIFYAPHGFQLEPADLGKLNSLKIQVLMGTFTEFTLPGLMGGKVNPGLANVRALQAQLQPQWIVNTHDEEKKMRGLVAKLAKVNYANYEEIAQNPELPWLAFSDYTPQIIELS